MVQARTPQRTLDEVKAEVLRRAGKLHPFEGLRREDAERVMASLTTLDSDAWAAAWVELGRRYEDGGDAAAKAGLKGHELSKLYEFSFDAYRTGRYPTYSSPGKRVASRRTAASSAGEAEPASGPK